MVILYGNDRATGEEAETASEMRKRGPSSTEFEFIDSIDDLDDRIQRNDVILENFDGFSFDGTDNFSTQNVQSQDPSPTASSGGSKRKKSKVVANKEKCDEILEIKGAMQEVAEALKDGTAAIREGNAIMKEQHKLKLPPLFGDEVWKLIKECGCEANFLPMIFCSLMQDIDKIRTIVQCPIEARKDVIMHLVLGSSNPPSS